MTTDTKPAAAPKVAATKTAAAEAPVTKTVAPVYALKRINGTYLPGDILVPDSDVQRTELVETLEAARDLTDGELALWEKINAVTPAADEDPIA